MGISAVESFRREGFEEGFKQGFEKTRENVATNMLKQGRTLEEVIEVTDLSQDQVETILHKIDGESKR